MFALLNLRLIAGLLVVAALSFTHFYSYRLGKQHVRTEWLASVAAANAESLRLERARQSRVDEAGRLAGAREARLRNDAAGSAGAVQRLRDELAALNARGGSCPSEAERTAAVSDLLRQCAEAHRELAERADRHVNDVRLLLDAWPTDPP